MSRRTRAGLTLIELLVVLVVVVLVVSGAAQAMGAGLFFERRLREDAAIVDRRARFERQLTEVIQRAFVNPEEDAATTYFIGGDVGSLSPTDLGESPNLGGTSSLVFTTIGDPLPRGLLAEDGTFEELNERFGAQGGISEYSLSTEPVAAPGDQQGLFLRRQTPADGDPSQGGRESVLWDEVTEVTWEFFDGVEWVPDWDTREQAEPRIPAAVRLTYRLGEEGDEENERILVIRCLHSDITADDPLTEETAAP